MCLHYSVATRLHDALIRVPPRLSECYHRTLQLLTDLSPQVMMGRTAETMAATLAAIEADGGSGTVIVMASIGASAGFGVATSDMALMEEEVIQGFDVACGLGELRFVCQNQGPNMPPPTGRDMREMTLKFITYMWEMNMGVSFVVGREAARRMIPGGGTLIFTGATSHGP
jgi:hypothetical protein